jgi:hypothetical protein
MGSTTITYSPNVTKGNRMPFATNIPLPDEYYRLDEITTPPQNPKGFWKKMKVVLRRWMNRIFGEKAIQMKHSKLDSDDFMVPKHL